GSCSICSTLVGSCFICFSLEVFYSTLEGFCSVCSSLEDSWLLLRLLCPALVGNCPICSTVVFCSAVGIFGLLTLLCPSCLNP
ncbi:hypothetical protein M9458_015034, partial [Cirrhinus mrigala]